MIKDHLQTLDLGRSPVDGNRADDDEEDSLRKDFAHELRLSLYSKLAHDPLHGIHTDCRGRIKDGG